MVLGLCAEPTSQGKANLCMTTVETIGLGWKPPEVSGKAFLSFGGLWIQPQILQPFFLFPLCCLQAAPGCVWLLLISACFSLQQ